MSASTAVFAWSADLIPKHDQTPKGEVVAGVDAVEDMLIAVSEFVNDYVWCEESAAMLRRVYAQSS